MATSFSTLYTHIRTLLGDTDSDALLYTDEILANQLRLTILFKNSSSIAENGTSQEFTADLTNKAIAQMVLETCINIISPDPDTFSHKTPVVSVNRRGGVSRLVSQLRRTLREVNGGIFTVKSDTDIQALTNAITRYADDITNAQQ